MQNKTENKWLIKEKRKKRKNKTTIKVHCSLWLNEIGFNMFKIEWRELAGEKRHTAHNKIA